MKARFGEFALDSAQRVLRRAGTQVALEPKVFDCIELLVRHAGRLITTERLRATLWPDTRVGPGALRRIINEARKAIGDRGDAQSLIRTRKGLGYVFTAAVEHDGSTLPAPSAVADSFAAPVWPFVGRARELGLLHERLATGKGGLCFVSGEEGAGKSTLLGALKEQLAARHADWLWLAGHCDAAAGLPAFWPFRELAEQIMKEPDRRARFLPLHARERRALRVIPELAGTSTAPSNAAAASAEARFEVCAAYAKLLCRLSLDRPLVIAIEDVHWADDGSVLMLETVARAAQTHPIVMLVSYRPEAVLDGKALSGLLARTCGRDGVSTVHLDALTLEDMQALLAKVQHPGSSRGAALALQQLTGGNALFVRELVTHSLATAAQLEGALPAGLPHIVAQRIGLLPEPARHALGQAAVLGHDFSLSLLSALSRVPHDALLRDLEPALRAGVLRRGGDDPDQLRFTHAVLCDALNASMPVERKQAHHREALRAWKSMPEGPARSGALALHAFMAGSSVPSAERRELCRRAGREAFEALAFDRAVLHLGRAVRLLDDGDSSRTAAELTLLWAKARWHADDPKDEVEHAFLQAAERARRARQPSLLAEAAIGYAVGAESSLYFRSAWRRPDAMALAEEAFALLTSNADDALEAPNFELRHRLAATLCWMRGEAGDLADFQRAAQCALEFAPKTAGPFRQISILALRGVAEPEAAAALHDELLAKLRMPGLSQRQRIEAYVLVMSGCLGRGDVAGYERAASEIERLSEGMAQSPRFGRMGERSTSYVAIPLFARVTLATIAGEFALAESGLSAIAAQAQRLGLTRTREGTNNVFYMLLQLLGYQGRSAALEPLLDQHLRAETNDRWTGSVAKAQFALERDDLDAAAAHYRVLRETGFRPVMDGQLLLVKADTLVRIADVCRVVGDAADAHVLYEKLQPRAAYFIHDGPLVCLGACSRVLGELAYQLGDYARAEQHFFRALAMNLAMGHRPEHVRAQLGFARLLRASGREREAEALLDAAGAQARAIGMAPAPARVASAIAHRHE